MFLFFSTCVLGVFFLVLFGEKLLVSVFFSLFCVKKHAHDALLIIQTNKCSCLCQDSNQPFFT